MTRPSVQLCLVLHNHQPVGNFDDVFEAAFDDSYLPFLDVFEPFSDLRISLHMSGPLAVWLDQRHPEYLDRLARLVDLGRIEIIGGAFYEPILAMLPRRDRIGQIGSYTEWLTSRLGASIRGMWIPERVWESEMATDLALSRIEYTVLDDYHFRRAGLSDDELHGFHVVEDQGNTIAVFPGSERLRYLIPFQTPQQTIDFCRQMANRHPGSVVVFGDDGEKFGTWPDTKKHVYQDGWLKQFFELLTGNRDWLRTSTLSDAIQSTDPVGKIWLPDASYREMTEWALPVQRQLEYERLVHEFQQRNDWPVIQPFLSGGFWRNFKVKYSEANEMYSRMMHVSDRLERASKSGVSPAVIDRARDHLYQGQCNCSYWHGAFGGIYLPHLRNAVYQNLIAAEYLLECAEKPTQHWIDDETRDHDFDGLPEVRLANEQCVAWFAPHRGGMMYEFDLRRLGHNLLATLQRRPEAYHEKIRAGETRATDQAASIHDRVVFKQPDLDKRLIYDQHPRKSLLDHFWAAGTRIDDLVEGSAAELGDFVQGRYQASIRRKDGRVMLVQQKQGNVASPIDGSLRSIQITKGAVLESGQSIVFHYELEGLPRGTDWIFGVEFNFAGLPAGLDDRYFRDSAGQRLGDLGKLIDLANQDSIGLTDQWLGLDVKLESSEPAGFWAYPIQTVSQSEGGFELVHQSVAVVPHWRLNVDAKGRWSAQITLSFGIGSSDNQRKIESLLASC